ILYLFRKALRHAVRSDADLHVQARLYWFVMKPRESISEEEKSEILSLVRASDYADWTESFHDVSARHLNDSISRMIIPPQSYGKYPTQAKSGGDRDANSTKEKIEKYIADQDKKKIGFFDRLFGREKSERLKNAKRYGIETKLFPWNRYVPQYDDVSKLVEKGVADQDASVWSTQMSGTLPGDIFTVVGSGAKAKDQPKNKQGLLNLKDLVTRYRDFIKELKDLSAKIDSALKGSKMPRVRSMGEAKEQ